MFDYFEGYQAAHQRGYMKFTVTDDEYQTLLKELNAHFRNHEVDVIHERDGKTVIIGIVGVEYTEPQN